MSADFLIDRDAADTRETRAWWERVFATWWPGAPLSWNPLNRAQYRGVDVTLIASGASVISLDVKTRGRWWPDLLLEIEHIFDSGQVTKGWALDPAWGPSFLAVGSPQSDTAALFYVPLLRRIVAEREPDLRRRADAQRTWIESRNERGGYTTRSIGIPLKADMRCLIEWYPAELRFDQLLERGRL